MPAPVARPEIATLPRYQPGRTAEAAMAEHGIATAVKLASNESPFGALPGVAEAVADAATGAHRYADHTASAVAERFADRVGVERNRVAVGPGSVGLLQQLALAFVQPGAGVAYPWPSFVAYPQFTTLVAGDAHTASLVRHTVDVDRLLEAVDTHRPRLVLLAQPNNPTSTALRNHELRRLVDGVPDDCLVVIDEAYHEYVTGADVPDAIDVFSSRPNVAVLRTLSKAYGLAALRIGFLVADPAVVDVVDACAIPFGVSAPAQAGALAAFEQDDEVRRRCGVVTQERNRVAQELRRRGLGVPDSQANFWWLPAGVESSALAVELERRGVVTRPLGDGVRVTVGTPDDNEMFLAAVDEVLTGGALARSSWSGATGANAEHAAHWIGRLDHALDRFGDHLALAHPGRTAPVPGETETWDAPQVWAHVAEFGDYWLDELDTVLESSTSGPVPFGRTRRDPARIAAIEHGRHLDPATHLDHVERSADRLRATLAGLSDRDWVRVGRHETLGDMDLAAQLTHFHVGHYEEHADQLDSIRPISERSELMSGRVSASEPAGDGARRVRGRAAPEQP